MEAFDDKVDLTVAGPASGFARLEVVEGPRGRRSWTPAFKARLVAQSYLGGETVSSLARRNGLRPQQLFDWRREARRGRLALPEEAAEALGMRPIDDAAPSDIQITLGAVSVALPGDASAERIAALAAALYRAVTDRAGR